MSRVIFSVTDDSIRAHVLDRIAEAEDENWIAFPDDAARAEFVEECVENVIYRFETADDRMFMDDYFNGNDVLDLANDYGYDVGAEA